MAALLTLPFDHDSVHQLDGKRHVADPLIWLPTQGTEEHD